MPLVTSQDSRTHELAVISLGYMVSIMVRHLVRELGVEIKKKIFYEKFGKVISLCCLITRVKVVPFLYVKHFIFVYR